ncbi:MAG: FG-GAP-like repeat-containing protein, partial [Polyangiaceae bacterium]|nr:FG-GAP-like repeat-containing protein [Polyangiaceae bacterium]
MVDPAQPLRFSDGKTQLCDINGDRVQDFCYLRSGALTYWLGRGRGQFESARSAGGVPSFEPTSPWKLVDLDGDGWTDLLHIGVTQVSYALAVHAGQFDAVRTIAGTPVKGPHAAVELADINGSGTTDMVWIDTTLGTKAWQYLELFPDGRGGLLKHIDNGLGKVTRISYGSAALEAAEARKQGKPWTTRINVPMPVVKRVETDASLGDPPMVVEHTYRDGAWDPVERTFAAFSSGTESQVGDEHTPTLLTSTWFDPGLTERTLRGSVLSSEQRDERGYVFSRATNSYVTRTLQSSLDNRQVHCSYRSASRTEHIEGTDEAQKRVTLTEWEQDQFGSVTKESKWGEVVGGDKLAGRDEALSVRTYANNVDDWVLGRLATEELTDVHGTRVSLRRNYYDGEPFKGLPLGQVTRGDVTRQEQWVGPGPNAFELDISTAYDTHGLPTETRDALGGGHIYTWDPEDHTTLLGEAVKLENTTLVELATVDRATGNLLSVTGYEGQTTRYEYDPLGRLIAVYHAGDPPGLPTNRYTYVVSPPVSRVITERRVSQGEDRIERSETLVDGASRTRGVLTLNDDGRWVLSGVSLLDPRAQPRRALRARFVDDAAHDNPPLQADRPGVDKWRDAQGRAIRIRTELGIETKHEFGPMTTRSWDGAQLDSSSPYEHTPKVESVDGLGRTVQTSQILNGAKVSSTYVYDAAGQLLSRTDPEQNTATYEYDGRGRRVTLRDPDAGEHRMKYDAAGNLIETRRPDGKPQRMTYDLAGRVLTEDWDSDGTPEVENVWDTDTRDPDNPLARGKLVSVRDPGGLVENEYDLRGLPSVTRHTIDGTTYQVASKYDNLDREVLHTYPNGSSIRIHRNLRGQMSGYGAAIRFDYDADGVETKRTFNTGVVVQTRYDLDRRVQERQVRAAAGESIFHTRYHYDNASNIVGIEDLRPAVDPSQDRSEQYAYDNLYRLREASGTWGQATWTYSPSGNLLTRSSSVASLSMEPVQYGKGAGPHAMTAVGTRTVRYDARGRMTDDGEQAYTWNDNDQLIGVKTRGGAEVRSRFDLNGERRLRVERTSLGEESRTHYIDAWAEVKDGRLIRYIVHGGQRIARLSEGNGKVATGALDAEAEEPPGAWARVLPNLAYMP